MSKFSRSYVLSTIVSAIFIVAGLYLAQMYLIEFPNPKLHWEGIAPLGLSLVYYLFS